MDDRTTLKRLYWWPFGYGTPPRYEMQAALRNYRLGKWFGGEEHNKSYKHENAQMQRRFEQSLGRLFAAWEQQPYEESDEAGGSS